MPVIEELMRGCVWSRRAPWGLREIPDSIVRAHNSCAQLIESRSTGGSDIRLKTAGATSRPVRGGCVRAVHAHPLYARN